MHENRIGTVILDTAISLHRELGPGLLETVYEAILQHELQKPWPELSASSAGADQPPWPKRRQRSFGFRAGEREDVADLLCKMF